LGWEEGGRKRASEQIFLTASAACFCRAHNALIVHAFQYLGGCYRSSLKGGENSHSHHISKGGHAKWFSSQKVDNPQILVLANRKSAFFGGCSIFSYIRVVCLL